MSPLRKVPVVSTTAPAPIRRPSPRTTPATLPSPQRGEGGAHAKHGRVRGSRLAPRRPRSPDPPPPRPQRVSPACARSSACTASRYSLRSAWARGPRTAGPLERLSMRNWMPPRSAARPMMPSSASISRTRWPLASPPMAGLHDISPTVAGSWVSRAVRAPARAAAAAASAPACPPPTTTTSNSRSQCCAIRGGRVGRAVRKVKVAVTRLHNGLCECFT